MKYPAICKLKERQRFVSICANKKSRVLNTFQNIKQRWETYCIYYPGPRKLWIIGGGPEVTIDFNLKYYFYLNTRIRGLLWHAALSICLSRSFVLTRFCTLNWVMKIPMRALSNVHAGHIWPTGRRFPILDLKASSRVIVSLNKLYTACIERFKCVEILGNKNEICEINNKQLDFSW